MTKQEFLEKYGDKAVFEMTITVGDLAGVIPDDAQINEENIEQALRKIEKGFEAGLMTDWESTVAKTSVDGSGLLKK